MIAKRRLATLSRKSIFVIVLGWGLGSAGAATQNVGASEALVDGVALAARVSELERQAKREEIAVIYGPLFQQLKWGGKLTDRVLEVMTVDELGQRNAWLHGSPIVASASERAENLRDHARADLQTMLDEAGRSALQGFRRLIPARMMVARFAGGAARLGVPLSIPQAEELTRVIAGASERYREGKAVEPAQVNWSAVDKAARAILSVEQWEFFVTTDLSWRWMVGLGLAMNQALATGELAKAMPDASADPAEAGRKFLMDHPNLAVRLQESLRARIRGRYLLVYRELGLSPEKVAEFERIELAGPNNVMNLKRQGTTLRLGPEQELSRSEQTRLKRELLGHDGYEKLMSGEFELMFSPVSEVASALSLSANPLTAAQAGRLASVISDARRESGWRNSPRATADYWAKVVTQAREFMSSEQIAALDLPRLRDELQAMRPSRATTAPKTQKK